MRKSSLAAAGAAFAAVIFAIPSAHAETNIDWFYNSGDHDAKARFRAVGEHIDLCKLNNGKVYVDYGIAGGGTTRTYYDGGIDTCKDIDWSVTDGKSVKLKVCEEKGAWPDDCSDWKYGTA